jgi:hypothetical protein
MKIKKLLLTFILVFSAVVHSEAPIEVDEQTGKYLGNLGANQHGQHSVNYRFEQHGSQYSKDSMNMRNNSMSQYSKDSMNKRNNPRWDAVVVDLRDTSRQRVYLRESKNNRNDPSGSYRSSNRYNQEADDPHNAPDHGPVLLVPIKEW